jgi:hypothetical protein
MAWDLQTLIGSRRMTDPGPRAVEAPRGKPTHIIGLDGRITDGDGRQIWPLTPKRQEEQRRQQIEAANVEIARRRRELTEPFIPSGDHRAAEARLTAAIRALAAHQVTMADWHARHVAALAPVERIEARLKEARREIASAKERLADLDRDDQAEVDRWAAAGAEGEMPAPDTYHRIMRKAAVSHAERETQMLEAPAAMARAGLAPIEAEGRMLGQQLQNFAATVLLEEAEVKGHRYVAALQALVSLGADLRAINAALALFRGTRMVSPKRADAPVAIAEWEDAFYFEERREVRGYWLRAHDYNRTLLAVASVDEIKARAAQWSRYATDLMVHDTGASEETLNERARLLDDNADLRAQLAARGVTADPAASIEGVSE